MATLLMRGVMRLEKIMDNFCIAVTGLPGSGKTTLGKAIAEKFHLPLLDKDDYLERLFEERGTGDLNWRQKLSRESDELFIRDARKYNSVVLVSHWRPRSSNSTSGTPVEWLEENFSHIIEIFCVCSVEEAAQRFLNRVRHPGHQDGLKTYEEIVEWLNNYNTHLPLTLGVLESLDGSSARSLEQVIGRLSNYVQSDA